MPDYGRAMYQRYRLDAELTQEAAAERLHISVRALADYEAGQRLPPDELVAQMVTVYDAPRLAYDHQITNSKVIPGLRPLEGCDLPVATIRLVNRIVAFADKQRTRQLLAIAEDGVISDDEQAQFDDIVKDLDDIINAALEVRFADAEED